ncbi:MAG: 50S ribosomal protein L2 [Dehalococcoidia bacterium]|nr:50S ribosomal protein L2 [Dehalococcoidia bacterium]
MALKTFRPTSPGRRHQVSLADEHLSRKEPEKSLIVAKRSTGGRNNQGKVTVRHRGGGVKRMLRNVDFKRDKIDVAGEVVAIEYDPNRTARLGLIKYIDGEKRYIIAPVGLNVGDTIMSGANAEIKVGNALPLKSIPVGTTIHNLELEPGKGAQIVRSAGGGAQLMSKEDVYCLVRLPSGELRRFNGNCVATVGQVGNPDHQNVRLGKAGRSRMMGRRPAVRGAAMSPRDHPHGGGEGRNPRGMHPKTPWGKPALGYKTRRRKYSDKFIVKTRHQKS